MNEPTLEKITAELSERLIGQKFGKIFPAAKLRLFIDFRLRDASYLFLSVEPNSPRIYLAERRLKDLEKQTKFQPSFVSFLRKRLANAVLTDIEKAPGERILKMKFAARSEIGVEEKYFLIVQMTGRSSNLFLLDENEFIIERLRETFGEGQEMAQRYRFPEKSALQKDSNEKPFDQKNFPTLSAALDDFYSKKERKQKFQALAQSARSGLAKDLKKRKRLEKKLRLDLENHGDAEKWKRFGDLLLANQTTARRSSDKVFVIDYFDENTPQIEIEVEVNRSLTEAAENFYKLYTKARNAEEEISKRLEIVEAEIEELLEKQSELNEAIAAEDFERVESYTNLDRRSPDGGGALQNKKSESSGAYAREFVSSEGFDILVGKRSKDNDYLTFRIAKSLDTWLHAADYPGSHVVIRNPNRVEIPPTTLVEAAQLAAFYSKAKDETKVAVHYTQKKHVNKPRGAAAGLVSLSSFKTILVEPKVFEQKK